MILLMSCASAKDGSKTKVVTSSLQGTEWVISSLPGFTIEETDRAVNLSFSDSSTRFGGYSGCNMYGGDFTVAGQQLKFSKILGTKRACLSGMKNEQTIFKVLEQTNNYSINANKLQLKQDDKVLAEWVRVEKK